MNCIVENLTRRPVTILCNSGKSYHLPPRFSKELAPIEVANNPFVEKLAKRKVLKVHDGDSNKKTTDKKSKTVAKKQPAKKVG